MRRGRQAERETEKPEGDAAARVLDQSVHRPTIDELPDLRNVRRQAIFRAYCAVKQNPYLA